jgi:hypothetical protein
MIRRAAARDWAARNWVAARTWAATRPWLAGPALAVSSRTALLAVLLVPVVTLLAWPIAGLTAQPGLDNSWRIGLHLAAGLGLRYGVDAVFTYGPLGFLGFPRPAFVGFTSALAVIASLAVYTSLVATILVEARRALPLWAAALVTLLVARFFAFLPPFEALEILAFLWSVEAIAGRIRLSSSVIIVVAAILGAVAALGKVNVGAFVAIFGAVTAATVAPRWWRGLALYAGASAVAVLVLWLATGQRPTDLPAFAFGSYQIVAGYQEAMGLDPQPDRAWVLIAVVGVIGLLAGLAYAASRSWPIRSRIGLGVVIAILAFSLWKLVVVREHAVFAFGTALLGVFAFAGTPIDRRTWLASVAALGFAFIGAARPTPAGYVDVAGSARTFVREAADAFRPWKYAFAVDRDASELRGRYKLDPTVLSAVAGHTVHIDPYEIGVALAYPEFRWSPLPIFQPYSAYTPTLDELDAARLRSPQAPDRILRQYRSTTLTDSLRAEIGRPIREGETFPFTVDGRFRWFDAPATTLETFCRYRQIGASGAWQVLARTSASCGQPEPLGTVTARVGEPVPVPTETRPDRFVTVAVHGLQPSIARWLRTQLLKAPDWYVIVDGTRYRLVPGTATEGLLLAVPPSVDGTGNFAFGPPIRTLAITEGLSRKIGSTTLTYEFMSVPLVGQ